MNKIKYMQMRMIMTKDKKKKGYERDMSCIWKPVRI